MLGVASFFERVINSKWKKKMKKTKTVLELITVGIRIVKFYNLELINEIFLFKVKDDVSISFKTIINSTAKK